MEQSNMNRTNTPPGGSRSTEVMRLPAIDASADRNSLPPWARTLVVQNPLSAPVFLSYSNNAGAPDPDTGAYDVMVPAASQLTYPVVGDVVARYLIGAVRYAASVPAADAGLFCTVSVQETNESPNVGPMSIARALVGTSGARLVDCGVVTAVDLLAGPSGFITAASGESVIGAWMTAPVALDITPAHLTAYPTGYTDAQAVAGYWCRMDDAGVLAGGAVPTPGAGGTVALLGQGGTLVRGPWAAGTAYTTAAAVVAAGHIWSAGPGGTSGGSAPDFAGNIGGTVTDNGITWTDDGAVPTAGSVHLWALVATP